jgi:hypothetical protein
MIVLIRSPQAQHRRARVVIAIPNRAMLRPHARTFRLYRAASFFAN